MAASGEFLRPQHRDRPYVLRYRDIPGPRYRTRYRDAMERTGVRLRRREPPIFGVPPIFSEPAPIPPLLELHEALLRLSAEPPQEMDEDY
jgi:hypothetical protein